MATETGGIYSILSAAAVYEAFTGLLGAARLRRRLVADHIRPAAGGRVLDIGCGPGDILDFMPGARYTGVDVSANYIEKARTVRGGRGTFHVGCVYDLDTLAGESFDLILALGLLHHLEDDEVRQLVRFAAGRLSPGGRLITIDPCYEDGQSPVARYIIGKDRGRNVRTAAGYRAFASEAFPSVASRVRHDLINIPYSHCILECGTA